jgi:hypothetical protein
MACTTVTVTVDGCCQPAECGPTAGIHFGAPRSTTAEQRAVTGQPEDHTHRRFPRGRTTMDLQVDKELPIGDPTFQDELGNTVPAPDGATATYTSDNTAAVLIVNAEADGVLVARSAGALSDDGAGGGVGPANIHAEITWTDGDGGSHTATADAQLIVVAGNAERAAINFGAPREITPDAPVA